MTNTPALTEAGRAEQAGFDRVMQASFLPAMEAQDNRRPVDFPALRKAMELYWSEFPNARRTVLTYYMDMFAKAHPERVQAEWASFTNCISPPCAELARGKVRFAELSRQPFEFEFTALDGRAVDLRKLRGRVVLIDFWATWCTPCLQQLPKLKRLYAAYHEKGFEIIGISLDRPEDKHKLTHLIAKEGLPWPQHFDGKVWQNEFAARYAVHSAPTTFLLDKEGRLAGINIEERSLEAEVNRLLGAGN